MKFCYVDESGTGDEPFAVMVGVLVDALRMRPTKADWDALLSKLSCFAGREVDELHTRDFYAGNGAWRGLSGQRRSNVTDEVLDWIATRKHAVVYASVDKGAWLKTFPADPRHGDVKTIWRFLGVHLVLGIQRHLQHVPKNKGNTVLVFDNEERERTRFTDLLLNPPSWVDSYYSRGRKQEAFDQIVDVPYFADSRDVPLLQAADFMAFFLRRHAELANGDPERYGGEKGKVSAWARKILKRRVSTAALYPKIGRCPCAELFFQYAPACLRS